VEVRRLGQQDDFWDGLVDTTEAEYVAVLMGYLDASTRLDDDTKPDEGGLLTAAVYLFESGRVRRFRQDWRDTFGSKSFSWADLIARKAPFAHLRGKEHQAEHDSLVAAGVSLVREYVIGGSLASIWIQDLKHYGPTRIKGFGHAYSVAGHMAMWGMGHWAQRNNYRGGISYVIEAGDDGYDQLDHLLSYASKVDQIAESYQWKAHGTVQKTSSSPFHAPDLFAWEWGKYWRETVFERKRPLRRSLASLLIDRLDTYTVMHLGGEPLMRFFEHFNALGVEQLQRDRAAAASVPVTNLAEIVLPSEQTTHVQGHE
jgi:hypothetical protein